MAVAGTQHVITRHGPAPVKRLADRRQAVELWTGDTFAFVAVERTPQPVPLLEVELSDGTVVRCTEDHVFHVPALSRGGYRKPVPARELHRGLKLARARIPAVDPDVRLPCAYEQGVYSVMGREGDGFKSITCRNATVAAKLRAAAGEVLDVTDRLTQAKSHVPTGASLASKRDWLSGLFDAMGVRWYPGFGKTVTFRDQEFVREVANLVMSCGVRCSLGFRSGDVATMAFSVDQAERLRAFLGDGVVRDDRDDGRDDDRAAGGGAGRTTYTVLAAAAAAAHPLVRMAKKSGPSVVVRSVKRLPAPAEAYSCPGALVI